MVKIPKDNVKGKMGVVVKIGDEGGIIGEGRSVMMRSDINIRN